MNAERTWVAQGSSLVACFFYGAAGAASAQVTVNAGLVISLLIIAILATVVHTAVIFDS